MSETYRIDEATRRVYVSMHGEFYPALSMSFDKLAGYKMLLGPKTDRDRREAYAVARDELLERGLIGEPQEAKG